MLKNRLISAFLLIPVVIAALFLLSPIKFAVIAMVACMFAAWEWGKINFFNSYIQRMWLTIFCTFLLIIMFLAFSKHYFDIYQAIITSSLWVSLIWWVSALLLVTLYPCSAIIWCNSQLLRITFGLLIIIPFFVSILALRIWHYDANRYSGAILLLYVILLVWSIDSGAYIFGKLFGKHKFAPKISSKKTWQGLVGGVFTTIVTSSIYVKLINLEIKLITLLVCSIVSVLASILGDLTESMFKREAGIKDSSHLIPGHGGMLDRIDSLTAAIPIFSFLLLLTFDIV